MIKPAGLPSILILLFVVLSIPSWADPIPLILDTDIGSDIDDTWALSFILCCTDEIDLRQLLHKRYDPKDFPEEILLPPIDLRMVLTDSHDTVGRAKIAAKFLEQVQREDIPVGIGEKFDDEAGPLAKWAEDYDLKDYPGTIYDDGIQAMIDMIMDATETINLLVLGPCPNIQIALQREPRIVQKTKVIAMSGSIDRGYNNMITSDAEYNVRDNIPAAKAMYQAGWDLTIAPLDTAGVVKITGPQYQKLMLTDNLVVQSLYQNYQFWVNEGKFPHNPGARSSTLFDLTAAYLAYDGSLCTMEDIPLRVDDKGLTVRQSNGKPVHCAMTWKNLEIFKELVIAVLEKGTTTKRQDRLIGSSSTSAKTNR